MAKKKKKKRINWNHVIVTFIVIMAIGFGIYKSCSFVANKVLSFFKEDDMKSEEIVSVSKKYYVATVVIDPGHGGYDAGANIGEIYEKDITLKTAQYLQKKLDERNIKAILTREEDMELDGNKIKDLRMRAQKSEQNQADYFVSIHVNDFAGNKDVSGFEVYTKNEESESLASSICEQMESLNITKNRGIVDGHSLQVLRDNTVPSVLIELGYIKGTDYQYLTDDAQLEAIADAVSKGIEEKIHIK